MSKTHCATSELAVPSFIGYLAHMRATNLLVATVVLGTSLAGMTSSAMAKPHGNASTPQALPRLTLHSPLVEQDGSARGMAYRSSLLTVGNFDAAATVTRTTPASYHFLGVSAFDSVPVARAYLYQVNDDTLEFRPYTMGYTGLRSIAMFDALARR